MGQSQSSERTEWFARCFRQEGTLRTSLRKGRREVSRWRWRAGQWIDAKITDPAIRTSDRVADFFGDLRWPLKTYGVADLPIRGRTSSFQVIGSRPLTPPNSEESTMEVTSA